MSISSFSSYSSALVAHNLPLFGDGAFGGLGMSSLRARRGDCFCTCIRDGTGLRKSCWDRDGYTRGDVTRGGCDISDGTGVGDSTSNVDSCGYVIGHGACVGDGIVISDSAGHVDCCRDPIGDSAGFRDRAIVGLCFPNIDSRRYIVRDSAIFGDRRRANWGRRRRVVASSFDSGGGCESKRKSEGNDECGVHFWFDGPVRMSDVLGACAIRLLYTLRPPDSAAGSLAFPRESGMKATNGQLTAFVPVIISSYLFFIFLAWSSNRSSFMEGAVDLWGGDTGPKIQKWGNKSLNVGERTVM